MSFIRTKVAPRVTPRRMNYSRESAVGSSTASTAEACVFAQRVSWFRSLPMRAIWWLRSRSMAGAGAVQVRVRHRLPQLR